MASMRKKFIGVAALAFVAALSVGVASVNVQADTDNTLSGFAITATSVRTNEPAGLRFKTDVGADAKTTYADAECYTVVSFTSSVSGTEKTYTAEVPAQVWRAEEDGWNTVLLDIPASDYATEITAQSFIVGENFTYETEPVTVSIAKTAAKALVDGIATKADVGHYAQGLVATATFESATDVVYAEKTVYVNNTVEDPATFATPSKAGSAFKGWTKNGEAFDFATPLTEDVTLVADYQDGAPIINAGNATNCYLAYETEVKAEGETHSWKINRTPGGAYGMAFNFNEESIVDGAEKYTFKVMVEFDPTDKRADNTYWDLPGGGYGWFSMKVGGTNYHDGMVIGTWYTIEVDAATFEACCANEGFVWLANGSKYTLQVPATLYMTDVKGVLPPATTCTVSFDVGAGTGASYEAQVVGGGECATDPATAVTPYIAGKAFKGWTLNGEAFDFSTPITGDITLVAAYEDGAPIVNAGNAPGTYMSYSTAVKPDGANHSWKVTRPVGGFNYLWNFNADCIVAGATQYTFQVMVEFTPSSQRPAGENTYWGPVSNKYGWFSIKVNGTNYHDGMVIGTWYTITVDAAAFEACCANEGFVWAANNIAPNVTSTLYITDVTAL